MKHRQLPVLVIIFACIFATNLSAEVISKRLTDVISSNGTGVINIFDVAGSAPDLTAPDIEAFRIDNNGSLAFAVDVNEAANGTEKSSSQGVAIGTCTLEVLIDGQLYTFNEFWTQTQSLLATKGTTNRLSYFTLIGDSGSSRITTNSASDINGSDFDSTLYVDVPLDLSTASAITLNISFADTNVQLGDPEAFYDYSNGYEDIAIISADDATYLDTLAAGQQEAPLVILASDTDLTKSSTAYFPSANGYYLSAFEDRYPSRGDYDFNDLVVAYRIAYGSNKYGKIVDVFGEGYLVAKGALYDLDWGLLFDFANASGTATSQVTSPTEGQIIQSLNSQVNFSQTLQLRLLPNTSELWQPADGASFVNTEIGVPLQQGHKFSFYLQLDSPVAVNEATQAPFSPYVFVHATNQLIQTGIDFKNDQGYPFGLVMPENWLPPVEHLDIGRAYPELTNYIKSGGNASVSWYDNANNNVMTQLNPGFWKW